MTPFPISDANPASFTDALPPKADAVVIGGGVIGVMTAWFLRRKGLSVVLCEKGRIAGEQSSRNWGWVRQQGRDAAELPIMMEASRLWPEIAKEADADLGFRREGVLYISNTEKDLAEHEAWLEIAKQHQLDTRLLSRQEVLDMLPGSNPDWPGGLQGGLWTASDGRAEPWIAVPHLARALQRDGVAVIEDCAVRCLDMAAGKVAGVVTEKGRVACDAVVLAGGSWSSLFLRNHGVSIPQLSVLSSVAATTPMPRIFDGCAVDNAFAFRRRQDGGYSLAPGDFHEFFIGPDAFRHFRKYLPELKKNMTTQRYRIGAPKHFPDAWSTPRRWSGEAVSPFEKMRVLNPAPSLDALEKLKDLFSAAFPKMERPIFARAWGGMIDTMPDVVPIVDRVAALPGLTLATGMSGHGFGIGPGMGRVLADLATGGVVGHDLSRFRLSRFSDGSKISGGPSL